MPNPEITIALKIRLRTRPKTLADKRCRLIRIDADAPGVAHVNLRVDRGCDACDGHRDAGEPLNRPDVPGDPVEPGRTGATMRKPTAPTESEDGEDGEQSLRGYRHCHPFL
jgi:hypothetical protein